MVKSVMMFIFYSIGEVFFFWWDLFLGCVVVEVGWELVNGFVMMGYYVLLILWGGSVVGLKYYVKFEFLMMILNIGIIYFCVCEVIEYILLSD